MYLAPVARRSRALAFGLAGASVVAGAACVAAFDGLAAEVLAMALIAAGLGAVVLLAFLEVGLSEDRERAEDEERRQGRSEQRHDDGRRPLRRRPRRPG
jgi:hypothetical protein